VFPKRKSERRGPNHPNDLLAHACIRHRFFNGTILPSEFERPGRIVRITPLGPLIATMWEPQLAAAKAGIGLSHTFEETIAPALASGALVPVLRDWWQEFSRPYLYYPSRRLMPGPLRAFVDFVRGYSEN
jgi:DNA-binding transcriptional LysR family regulator